MSEVLLLMALAALLVQGAGIFMLAKKVGLPERLPAERKSLRRRR